MSIRSVIAILCSIALGGLFIMSCDKSPNDGNAPFVCTHRYDSLVLISTASYGSQPMDPAIPLDSIRKIVITDYAIYPMANMSVYESGRPTNAVGKLIFK